LIDNPGSTFTDLTEAEKRDIKKATKAAKRLYNSWKGAYRRAKKLEKRQGKRNDTTGADEHGGGTRRTTRPTTTNSATAADDTSAGDTSQQVALEAIRQIDRNMRSRMDKEAHAANRRNAKTQRKIDKLCRRQGRIIEQLAKLARRQRRERERHHTKALNDYQAFEHIKRLVNDSGLEVDEPWQDEVEPLSESDEDEPMYSDSSDDEMSDD
jgi:hypothetical protein